MNDEDMEVDDIFENNKPKKQKVDGKSKGDRTELHLCKLLANHFGETFSRALGSGSRDKQVNLPDHAKKALSGDICVPEFFKWIIECKGGYEDDMDAWNIVDGQLTQLDKFIEQVSRDAEYTKRKPILCWKRNRKPWVAGIKSSDFAGLESHFPNRIIYGEWVLVCLDKLLEVTDRNFWFEVTK
jgi:hypothetical protein